MIIGVTGTRSGCNEKQMKEATDFLIANYSEGSEFHHGDCVGVDVELAAIAKAIGYKIVCHPPTKPDMRGYFPSDESREPLSYFARNRKIVEACQLLMVVPYQDKRQNNGGTWYTYDYAYKRETPFKLFLPAR